MPKRAPRAATLHLADQMAAAWVSFVAAGNPNNPNWQPMT
jgi:hypothetical protein